MGGWRVWSLSPLCSCPGVPRSLRCPGAARQTRTRLTPRCPSAPRPVTCALGYSACVPAAARVPVAFGCSAHGSGSGFGCGSDSDSDSAASDPCDAQTVSASESPDPFGGPRRACAGVNNQEAWRRGLSLAAARPGLPKLRLIPGSNLLPLPWTPGTT